MAAPKGGKKVIRRRRERKNIEQVLGRLPIVAKNWYHFK